VEALLTRYHQSGDTGDEGDRGSGGQSADLREGASAGWRASCSDDGVAPGQSSRTISAPTSPLKEKRGAGFFGKMSNFSQVVSAKVELAKDAAGNIRVPGFNKDHCFTLLIIDDANTEWSKYFRGRRIHGDWDIRVEQAEFSEIAVSASIDQGVLASIVISKNGNKIVRSFRPDFLLVRQNLRDANEDYRNLLLGFKYGNIPSVNSLDSIYQFQDKPWVFANMVKVQQKLGREHFPLIEQTYFPNHRDMLSNCRFPCVIKIGHAHSGCGKVRVENASQFQDMMSVIAISNSYCTVEPYIESKFDLHIQKIGSKYKALMRKSLSGTWKTNVGQSILEEISVSEKHKLWIETVSEMFGGLDICSLEAVVGRMDGKEWIIEVNDSATTLMGESQEDDRKNIADVVIEAMEEKCIPVRISDEAASDGMSTTEKPLKGVKAPSMAAVVRTASRTSMGKTECPPKTLSSTPATLKQPAGKPTPPHPPPPTTKELQPSTLAPTNRTRHDSRDSTDSSASESSTVSEVSNASSTVRPSGDSYIRKNGKEKNTTSTKGTIENNDDGETEDTMKNLRKTFAGIFGETN